MEILTHPFASLDYCNVFWIDSNGVFTPEKFRRHRTKVLLHCIQLIQSVLVSWSALKNLYDIHTSCPYHLHVCGLRLPILDIGCFVDGRMPEIIMLSIRQVVVGSNEENE